MIHNLHFLIDPEATPDPQIRKVEVSQYIIINEYGTRKWVFGWDQPLQSFYLQVHDMTLPEDDRIITWLGADENTKMYEVEELFQATIKQGVSIPYRYRAILYGDRDEGV